MGSRSGRTWLRWSTVLLPAIQRGRCRSARMPGGSRGCPQGQVHHQDPSNLHWSGHMHDVLSPEEHAEMVTAVLGVPDLRREQQAQRTRLLAHPNHCRDAPASSPMITTLAPTSRPSSSTTARRKTTPELGSANLAQTNGTENEHGEGPHRARSLARRVHQ